MSKGLSRAKREIWDSLVRLRADAIERRLIDAALVYGNSALRLGLEIIAEEGAHL